MKEIKFRAKSKHNGEWVYAEIHGFGMDLFGESIDEETICQYTGIKDKHGNEIYAGDILRSITKDLMYVVYDDKEASFMTVFVKRTIIKLRITDNLIKKYPKEVIGNIFDDKLLID